MLLYFFYRTELNCRKIWKKNVFYLRTYVVYKQTDEIPKPMTDRHNSHKTSSTTDIDTSLDVAYHVYFVDITSGQKTFINI